MSHRTILLTILISLGLNFSGTILQQYAPNPLFLDTTGTMLSAVLLGPWVGGLIGLLTNTLQGIIHTPVSIPFGIVNMGVGLTAGYIVKHFKGYRHWYVPLTVGLTTGLIAALLAAPIAAYLFGGITGHGVDKIVVALADGGRTIISSAFLGRLPYSFADKLISAYAVYVIIRLWPTYRALASESEMDQKV